MYKLLYITIPFIFVLLSCKQQKQEAKVNLADGEIEVIENNTKINIKALDTKTIMKMDALRYEKDTTGIAKAESDFNQLAFYNINIANEKEEDNYTPSKMLDANPALLDLLNKEFNNCVYVYDKKTKERVYAYDFVVPRFYGLNTQSEMLVSFKKSEIKKLNNPMLNIDFEPIQINFTKEIELTN